MAGVLTGAVPIPIGAPLSKNTMGGVTGRAADMMSETLSVLCSSVSVDIFLFGANSSVASSMNLTCAGVLRWSLFDGVAIAGRRQMRFGH
jgi:hypothetical protein